MSIDLGPSIAGRDRTRLETLSEFVLRAVLPIALALLAIGQWATWLPHLLTWPWFPDHDVFATAALEWNSGRLPYREMLGNNFPGTIELFAILGRLFGWGKTWPLFAFEGGLVVALGLMLIVWSRKRFGASLPGLVGFVTFLGYELGLDYSQVAQRDGHSAIFVILAILLAETWPRRFGRIASGMLFGLALAFRPQPIVFMPALFAAILERRDDRSDRRAGASLAEFALGAAVALTINFAPLAIQGLLGDFVKGIRLTGYGQGYNKVTPLKFVETFVAQTTLKELAVPLGALLLFSSGSPKDRDLTRTWLIALGCAWFYKPISPLDHAYLTHPLTMIWSINVAVLAAIVFEAKLSAAVRLAMIVLAIALQGTVKPRFCNPRAAIRAWPILRRGEIPKEVPTGYIHNPLVPLSARYDWDDYRETLEFLRNHISKSARIANALKAFPALCGPLGRRSAFPAESVAWLRMVRAADEARFAEALEKTPDSIVVWAPSEIASDPGFPLNALEKTIRAHYRLLKRFGTIEIWERAEGTES